MAKLLQIVLNPHTNINTVNSYGAWILCQERGAPAAAKHVSMRPHKHFWLKWLILVKIDLK